VYPESPQVILDTGNFSDNPTAAGEIKTRSLLEAMERLGYAAVNVGERELLMGYDDFAKKTAGISLPFVSTNLVRQDTKEPVLEPYVVIEAKRGLGKPPFRIGVLGVVRFNPLFRKSGPDGSSLVIASPKEMVKRYLPELRRRADAVVLLAALHQDDARLLAREVPGIDFILGAYGGYTSAGDSPEGTTTILYAGNQGKELGEARVFFEGDKLARAVSTMHHLSVRYPDAETMLQFTNEVASRLNAQAALRRQAAEEVKSAAGRAPFAGAAACGTCHVAEHEQWQSTAHARALEALVEQKKQGDLACLTCHVTGAGEEGGFRDPEASPHLVGVTCESCHGPGAEHAARPVRGYGKTDVSSCIGCHNRQNSPRFDYYVYLPKVVHAARSAR